MSSRIRGRSWRALTRAVIGRSPGVPLSGVPAALLELERSGPAALSHERVDPGAPLRIATVIPSFQRGSGGHATIVNLMRELSRVGHTVTLWLEDFEGRHAREPAAVTARNFADWFGAAGLELRMGFAQWSGADVVLATGWQTVPRALLLPDVRGRAYLVQDHEPDFYGASAESLFAEATYRQDFHCIAASEWLAELLRGRYGATASYFDLAVDHSVYRPGLEDRRDDLLVFYARSVTPRRAVPLGLLALEELSRRRPGVEIALFGENRLLVEVPFEHTSLGTLHAAGLARLYSRATVGMGFSLTNPSLVSLEMMACGLPCVELSSDSMVATFGVDGPALLAPPEPLQVCSAIERLLADADARDRIARLGVAFMQPRTWSRSAQQVELGLRAALVATG